MLQVDVFTVEAVSLGQLSRLVVGHGETTVGEGWYLADVTVAESDKPSGEQTYFPCNRSAIAFLPSLLLVSEMFWPCLTWYALI